MKPRLTSDEFQAWRAHPITEIVHRYLLDAASAMRRDFAMGANWTEEAKQLAQSLEDLAAIDLESIETFYEAIEADGQISIENEEQDIPANETGY